MRSLVKARSFNCAGSTPRNIGTCCKHRTPSSRGPGFGHPLQEKDWRTGAKTPCLCRAHKVWRVSYHTHKFLSAGVMIPRSADSKFPR